MKNGFKRRQAVCVYYVYDYFVMYIILYVSQKISIHNKFGVDWEL